MCGIFGIVWHTMKEVPEQSRLKETARLLHHRGPDSHGIYSDIGIGLVHTRLSLLDLSSNSAQPFWSRCGRYCLVYNGELYNFKDLRDELEQENIVFRTTGDTEVLLEAIIAWGVSITIPKLEGMFAFAFYDKYEKTITLVRDRFGIKPLYVYDEENTFVFASEISAMRPWINYTPDLLSISSYLYGFGGPTKGYTFYNCIKSIAPGSVVKVYIGRHTEYKDIFSMIDFWDEKLVEELMHLKPLQAVDRVEECLVESVKKTLFADALVGAFCSGGVDSSVLLAIAKKFHNNLAIFHADIVGPSSEYDAALQLARHLKLELKTVTVHDQDFIDQFPYTIAHFGHPFQHAPHALPFKMVSQLARDSGVKAVLTGEGSDECYLGYSWLTPDIRNLRKYIKCGLRKGYMSIFKQLKSYDTPMSNIKALVMGLNNRFETDLETDEISTRSKKKQDPSSNKSQTQSLELLNWNLRALLHRNDAMGMAASIESRFPFLDSALVSMAVNMPFNYKIRFSPTSFNPDHLFFIDKWVLRKVACRYLPKELSERPKKPFVVDAFWRMEISPAYFLKSDILDLFGLSSREIEYLVKNADRELKLKLLHLDVWCHVCLNNLSKESIAQKLRAHIDLATTH